MILSSPFAEFAFGGYSIDLCEKCPNVHFRFYRDVNDDNAVMSLNIGVDELDEVIAALLNARTEARMRPKPPAEPTHEAPETTQ